MKILSPFLLLLGILPLINCHRTPYDLQKRARLRREVPYVRTTRRASLHELLKMNGNVASVSENSEGRGQIDDPPSASDINDNRRVLVTGDGDEPPNYIDDDKVTSDTKFDDYDTKTQDQDKPSEDSTKGTNIGATVTKYLNPFSSASAPSYADHDLLTAVMKQADKANFRFPGEHSSPQYKRESSSSTMMESGTAPSSIKNDVNPYKKYFPPAFHELLDIPMHIYRNGSAKLDYIKKTEPKMQAPKISGGYASTNINSPSLPSQERERVTSEVREKATTRETNINYKPAVRRPIKSTTLTGSPPTTVASHQNTQNTNRQRPTYTEVERKSNRNEVKDHIPPNDLSNLSETKMERPSLQFGTKSPGFVIPITTEESPNKENKYYTEPTSLNVALPLSESNQDLSNLIKTQNRFRIQEAIRIPTPRPLSSQPDLKGIKGDAEFTSDTEFNDSEYGKKVPGDLVKSKEQIYRPVEIIPQKISSYKSTEVLRRETPISRPVERIQISLSSPKPNNNPPINHPSVYNPPTYNPKSNEGEKSKLPFKPSKVDPYLSSGISITPYSGQPTTFRPDYQPFRNVHSNIAQHNNAYKIYSNQGKEINGASFKIYDTRSTMPSNIYNVYDTQGAPKNSAYNTQGVKSNFPNDREESGLSYNRPNWFQEDNLSTEFPFARHPTVDKHTFEQKFQPGAFSSFQRNEDVTVKRPDELYSDLNGSLRPPPTYNPSNEYNVPQQRRRFSRPQRKRPSLLKNFGFFKRRSGVSGSSSDINSVQSHESEKESSKYLLTKGPIPHNAQKVTVIGPFKNPPIGAPKVYPLHIPAQDDSLMPTVPSTKLIPPSPFHAPALLSNDIDISNREPSFKVINLPREDGLTINQSYTVPSHVNNEITEEEVLTSDKNIERSSIIYGQKNIFYNPKVIDSNSTVVDVGSIFHVGNNKKEKMSVIPSYPGQQKEVSEADKERIIAAKFVFPRVQAVRRSGFDSHVIPIPVPLLGTSGNQVHQMQRIILPKLPIKRRILLEPQRKNPRRVDTAPIHTHDPHMSNRNPNQNGFVNPSHSIDSRRLTPLNVQSHDSLLSIIQNGDTNPSSEAKLNVNSFKESDAKRNTENEKISTETIFDTATLQGVAPMKIAPHVSSTFISEKGHMEPQSFVEPTNSTILYGDWKVVGESKVDPKGVLDPVVSFVIENTPEILLKADFNKKQDSTAHEKESLPIGVINKSGNEEITNKNIKKTPEIILGKSKEDKMVKFSSLLNIEGPDDTIKSFLVDPPKTH